jgi:hypothetical protein
VKGFHEYGGIEAIVSNDTTQTTVSMNTISGTHYRVVYNGDGSSDWTYSITGPDGFVTGPTVGAVLGYAGREWWGTLQWVRLSQNRRVIVRPMGRFRLDTPLHRSW